MLKQKSKQTQQVFLKEKNLHCIVGTFEIELPKYLELRNFQRFVLEKTLKKSEDYSCISCGFKNCMVFLILIRKNWYLQQATLPKSGMREYSSHFVIKCERTHSLKISTWTILINSDFNLSNNLCH